ncbi:hypothetical protein K438DRAFT_1774980 [Mycena galopus ATCC 62051]|nr:hypothetical protein K438DRAFT_1774980 [Mycena galopus ATCC 62051]
MYSRNVAAGGPTIPRQGAAAGAEPNDESWLPGEPNPSSALWPEFAPEAAGQVNDWSVRPQETTRTHPQTDRAQAPPVSDPRRVNWATWEPNPNLVDTPPSQKQPEISWDSAQGYPPRQAHSAQVPPVAGAYPLPPHVYNSAQVPYQPSRSEPLFVPVNPFEPRWRGAPLRAQQQPIDLDNDLDVAPSGPRPGQSTAYARYPTQPHSAESSSNDHWMHPSGPPPAQSAASAAYPTRPQPTDFANNPVWIGADLPHPPLRGQNPAYPVWANAPTRGPFIPFVPEFFPQPAFIPFIPPGPGPTLGVVAPQLHPDSVPVPTNGNESNDIERVARSRPYVSLTPEYK